MRELRLLVSEWGTWPVRSQRYRRPDLAENVRQLACMERCQVACTLCRRAVTKEVEISGLTRSRLLPHQVLGSPAVNAIAHRGHHVSLWIDSRVNGEVRGSLVPKTAPYI